MYFKKLVITLTIGCFLLAACSKEDASSIVLSSESDPTESQQVTVFYFGGTWCRTCGSLGKPAKEALKKELKDSVSIVSCQIDDPLNNDDASELAKLFNADRVPYMYTAGVEEPSFRVLVLSTMSEDAVSKAKTYLTKKPTANMQASFYLNGNGLLQVDSKIKFFKDVPNEFYVAAYLTEDNVFSVQTADSSFEKDIHHSVLRTKMGMSVTGDKISENPIKKDMIFKKSFETVLNPSYRKEKLNAVLVIWKKNEDGSYVISNSIVAPIKN
jgi:hypothetical protein